MKLKKGLVLRYVDGMPIVVPIGAASMDFNGMIRLNESGAFLWKQLAAGGDVSALTDALQEEYAVERQEAEADVRAFLATLQNADFLEKESGE